MMQNVPEMSSIMNKSSNFYEKSSLEESFEDNKKASVELVN